MVIFLTDLFFLRKTHRPLLGHFHNPEVEQQPLDYGRGKGREEGRIGRRGRGGGRGKAEDPPGVQVAGSDKEPVVTHSLSQLVQISPPRALGKHPSVGVPLRKLPEDVSV